MDFGQRLADLAMDRRVAAVGAGRCLPNVVAADLSRLDAFWTSRKPHHNAAHSGHRFLSRDYADLVSAAAGAKRSNATEL